MYGLLIQSFKRMVEDEYGDQAWERLMNISGLRTTAYHTRLRYMENTLPKLMASYAEELGVDNDHVAYENGVFFCNFLHLSGYGDLLQIQGRNFFEFLRNVDTLHEYLKFSYPNIKSPSFLVLENSPHEIILLYESRRTGFTAYVQGQLVAIAERLYNLEIQIEIRKSYQEKEINKVVFEITSKNAPFYTPIHKEHSLVAAIATQESLGYIGEDFFSIFPFHLVISEEMVILHSGESLNLIDSDLVGCNLTSKFTIIRPFIEVSFEKMFLYESHIFDIESLAAEKNERKSKKSIKLTGQMRFIPTWRAFIFIGTPLIANPNELQDNGLFLCDMNKHDHSREIVVLGNQRSDVLMCLVEQQKEQCQEMQKTAKHIYKIRNSINDLLYQCIPRTIAKSLRSGASPLETIRSFENVSIGFTKIPEFSTMCGLLETKDIVILLNKMYSIFDEISERNRVYKVETIGDSYMLASGLPSLTEYHSAHIAEVLLNILEETSNRIFWPLQKGQLERQRLEIQIGCHSGPVVAGVVGYHAPRYCIFGNTVNVASRMMSHGQPGKVHISSDFADEIRKYPYILEERGIICVKGKGEMMTYFLLARTNEEAKYDEYHDFKISFQGMLIADRDRKSDNEETSSIDSIKSDDDANNGGLETGYEEDDILDSENGLSTSPIDSISHASKTDHPNLAGLRETPNETPPNSRSSRKLRHGILKESSNRQCHATTIQNQLTDYVLKQASDRLQVIAESQNSRKNSCKSLEHIRRAIMDEPCKVLKVKEDKLQLKRKPENCNNSTLSSMDRKQKLIYKHSIGIASPSSRDDLLFNSDGSNRNVTEDQLPLAIVNGKKKSIISETPHVKLPQQMKKKSSMVNCPFSVRGTPSKFSIKSPQDIFKPEDIIVQPFSGCAPFLQLTKIALPHLRARAYLFCTKIVNQPCMHDLKALLQRQLVCVSLCPLTYQPNPRQQD